MTPLWLRRIAPHLTDTGNYSHAILVWHHGYSYAVSYYVWVSNKFVTNARSYCYSRIAQGAGFGGVFLWLASIYTWTWSRDSTVLFSFSFSSVLFVFCSFSFFPRTFFFFFFFFFSFFPFLFFFLSICSLCFLFFSLWWRLACCILGFWPLLYRHHNIGHHCPFGLRYKIKFQQQQKRGGGQGIKISTSAWTT